MAPQGKKSFRLRPNKNGVLELTEVKEKAILSDEESVCGEREGGGQVNEGNPKSWRSRLMQKLKKSGNDSCDEELQQYKDSKLRLSTFESLRRFNPYILVVLRLILCAYSIYLTVKMVKTFYEIIETEAKAGDGLKKETWFYRFGAEFILASTNSDRSFMMIFLMSVLPLVGLSYAFFVAFFATLYVTVSTSYERGMNELEKELWTEKPDEDSERRMRRHKTFSWCRMESCSTRMDCVLGYALTPLLLNTLQLVNFKNIPQLSVFYGVSIVLLVLVDEFLMKKRKFETEAGFKMFTLQGFILVTGLSWIFFIRFMDKDIRGSFSEDLGFFFFMTVIDFIGLLLGCFAKFLIRRIKPTDPEITRIPRYSIRPKESAMKNTSSESLESVV